MTEMSLIKEAAEIVRCQPRSPAVDRLKRCNDTLRDAWLLVRESPTRNAIRYFNTWAGHVCRAIDDVHAAQPTPPQGGAIRLDRHQLAA